MYLRNYCVRYVGTDLKGLVPSTLRDAIGIAPMRDAIGIAPMRDAIGIAPLGAIGILKGLPYNPGYNDHRGITTTH